MLIYHPAYDAYHCVFRALLITNVVQSIELQKLRLLDFFLTFPSELRHVLLPRQHSEAKKIASKMFNEYHGPVNKIQAFRDMEHIQKSAYSSLAALRIFDLAQYAQGIVNRTEVAIPDELTAKIYSGPCFQDSGLSWTLS